MIRAEASPDPFAARAFSSAHQLMKTLRAMGFALVTASLCSLAGAEVPQELPTVHHRVIWDSTLSETCTECGSSPAVYPLRGSAEMRFGSSVLGKYWTLSDIQMDTVHSGPRQYHLTGSGTWSDSGQFCFPRCYTVVTLSLQIDDGTTNRLVGFYERNLGSIPEEPILQLSADQMSDKPTFAIVLRLAPVQDLWFSSRRGLTSTPANAAPVHVANGDVLADSGRVVKGNADLLQSFGLTPDPALGGYDIDALGVAPGGAIVFSLREDVRSPTAGLLQHGDLLSDRGRIVKANQALLQPFEVASPAVDAGLDGIEILGENFALFSITTNVFSSKLGVMLTSGDLLSEAGAILSSNQQLLAALQPNPKDQNYGLAAFHAWYTPMAVLSEVWFCTEVGFESKLGPIAAGDLISSAGYIVYRNLELVANFRPVEDLADFGLDGVFVIREPRQVNLTSRLTGAVSPAGFMLRWATTGRVTQVERAASVEGPFRPVSPILPGLEWLDAGAVGPDTPLFYRLRLW